jgi:hypothetical protein
MKSWLVVSSLLHVSNGFSLSIVSWAKDPSSKAVNTFAKASRRISNPFPLRSAAISTNEYLLPGIESIDRANDEICARLGKLRDNPYFRLYSVDILASCEYMPQELFECYSETCEIYPVDDDEVRMHHDGRGGRICGFIRFMIHSHTRTLFCFVIDS